MTEPPPPVTAIDGRVHLHCGHVYLVELAHRPPAGAPGVCDVCGRQSYIVSVIPR